MEGGKGRGWWGGMDGGEFEGDKRVGDGDREGMGWGRPWLGKQWDK